MAAVLNHCPHRSRRSGTGGGRTPNENAHIITRETATASHKDFAERRTSKVQVWELNAVIAPRWEEIFVAEDTPLIDRPGIGAGGRRRALVTVAARFKRGQAIYNCAYNIYL